MGAALLDISAKGPQDAFLTEDPTITFFRNIHRRHTAFAMESTEVVFNGSVGFDRTLTATIPTNGDLMYKTGVQINLPALSATGGLVAWTRNIGYVLLKEIELKIGGQRVDKHYGIFMFIWKELTISTGHESGRDVSIGNTVTLTTPASSIPATTLYVPLQFQYCRSVGSSIPLIALQHSDVTIEVKTRPFSECYVASNGATVATPTLSNMSLWVDYIHLSAEERTAFVQTGHEYLIEQLQFTGSESSSQTSVRRTLNFNHPCSTVIWAVQLDSNVQPVSTGYLDANRWTDFTDGTTPYGGGHHLVDAKLMINGNDRTVTRDAMYFNITQSEEKWLRTPVVGIYSYSFALKPYENQPTGSINFSRIDNTILALTMASSAACNVFIYALNKNIYRYISGLGGSAYAS